MAETSGRFIIEKTLVKTSDDKRIGKVSDHVVEKIRQEVSDSMNGRDLHHKVEDYIHQLSPKGVDYEEVKHQMEHFVNEISMDETFDFEDPVHFKKIFKCRHRTTKC